MGAGSANHHDENEGNKKMNLLQQMVAKLPYMKNLIDQARKSGFSEGYAESEKTLQKIRDAESDARKTGFLHIGGTAICVSNEWDENNLIHGEIKGFFDGEQRIPIILDQLSGKEFVCMGITIPYHESMLSALEKLNPFERYSMLNAKNCPSSNGYIFDKPIDNQNNSPSFQDQ